MKVVQQFLKKLDSAIESAPTSLDCPLSRIRASMKSGNMSATDALGVAGALIYTGTESLEIISEGIVWMLAHPSNRQLQNELRQEIDTVLGGPKKVIENSDQIDDLNLLKATIAEALRCYEFAMPFQAMRDFKLGGKTMKKGSFFLVPGFNNQETSVSTGRKEWVESPSTFNPKVWLNEYGQFDTNLFNKFSFFGQGQHKCPGRQLGFDAVLGILAATISHFEDISFGGATDSKAGNDASFVPVENVSQFRKNYNFHATAR